MRLRFVVVNTVHLALDFVGDIIFEMIDRLSWGKGLRRSPGCCTRLSDVLSETIQNVVQVVILIVISDSFLLAVVQRVVLIHRTTWIIPVDLDGIRRTAWAVVCERRIQQAWQALDLLVPHPAADVATLSKVHAVSHDRVHTIDVAWCVPVTPVAAHRRTSSVSCIGFIFTTNGCGVRL